MSTHHRPALVRATLALEDATALDGAVGALRPHVTRLFGSGVRGRVLRGDQVGHALHPVLTNLVLGSWTSAGVLDVVGGAGAAGSAQRLVATGLLFAGPTAWTGWAEWSGTGQREQRVGLVHAATNGASIGLYAASYLARRRGDHRAGRAWALAGATVSSVGAYLGGHLSLAKKVGSHHPAYDAT
ncbi:(2Fe-2S)-binding protein [Marmoricola sp. Leaf446]|uniref:hypothetical protein n=1 Tax=Marmoricola sp. Leaf446 TaxID=1736379 RepID=UPI0006F6040F|nr:hypothetical protein [Marmoricola sp. Leaf446]KQT89569.1 (2Fe-2S)-binding protein [Marmoricola sp. Leaf446]